MKLDNVILWYVKIQLLIQNFSNKMYNMDEYLYLLFKINSEKLHSSPYFYTEKKMDENSWDNPHR